MMSSLKFSYWSSPQTSTKSGLKSSRILRIARKSLPNRSPQRFAAESPSSLPSSASISFGQFAGSFRAGSTLGASSTRLKTPVSVSLWPHSVGQCVTPNPRISAIACSSVISQDSSARSFGKPRDIAVDMDPGERVVAENLTNGADGLRVVQRAGEEDREARPGLRLLKQRRTAFRAEGAKDRLAAATERGVGLDRTGQRHRRPLHGNERR